MLQSRLPQADVFIEGFRGRKMDELGFGVEQVARAHPGTIYCSVRPEAVFLIKWAHKRLGETSHAIGAKSAPVGVGSWR